ncbi:MAG: signal recognition particle-docking protein FtsY [Deltaproteobacteria bacterium]|jgi:fused signal recognition particle receptor|nr:signal recognition particle-docking protein FtsY [Deltaproteobacteria bacterium]
MFKFFWGKDKPPKEDLSQQVGPGEKVESTPGSTPDEKPIPDADQNLVPPVQDLPTPPDLPVLPDQLDSSGLPQPGIAPLEPAVVGHELLENNPPSDPTTPATLDLAPTEPEVAQTKKGWFGRLKSRFTGGDKTVTPVEAPPTEADVSVDPAEKTPEVIASPPAITSAPVAEPVLETAPASEIIGASVEAQAAESAARAELSGGRAEELTAAEPPQAEQAPVEQVPVEQAPVEQVPVEQAPQEQAAREQAPQEQPKLGWFARLKQKLVKTRDRISGRLEKLLSFSRVIDEAVLEELEEILITSDLGVKTTEDLLVTIRDQVKRSELKDSAALKVALREKLLEVISLPIKPVLEVKPLVIMIVGVNGVGKTTTIAKLARFYQEQGKSVLLAAGDTFRAAAVEQLIIWAKRVGADIVSQPTGADASAVVFDSLNAAKARGVDVVIIDTAGRLHTKVNLMEELKKIKRVANKACPGAPHETILVLDANTGQNAASQARTFHESIVVDSLIITKLDGTSKGGVVVSIINELKLPVSFIGLGETFEDLRPFVAADFVEAIMGTQDL